MYIEQAANIEAAGRAFLVELLQEQDPEKQKALYKDIKEYEHSGDMITAKLYEELNKTFVTPFDREDINLLSGRMDRTRFLISCSDAAKRMLMCRPKSVNQLLIAMGQCIVEECSYLEGYHEWAGVYSEETYQEIKREMCSYQRDFEH